MSSNTTKPSVKETASCAWTFPNFSKARSYSSEFKSSNENSSRFQLKLYQKSSDGLKSRFVVLRIECTNFNPNTNSKLHLKCRISVLDTKDAKHFTTELNFELCDKNRAKIFSLFEREYLTANADKYLINDNLKIYCEIDVLDSSLQDWKNLSENLQSLLIDRKFSDATLIVGSDGKKFNVHKAILSARSAVFAAMFEHDCEEKRQNEVKITDIDQETCDELLVYIYTGKVMQMDRYALDLLQAADKYQLESLKNMAEDFLCSTLSVETAANVLFVADLHGATKLKDKCLGYICENANQVKDTDGWKILEGNSKLLGDLFFYKNK